MLIATVVKDVFFCFASASKVQLSRKGLSLDVGPSPMIEFLELHACSVSKVVTPSNGARAAIATQNSMQYSEQAGSGAGGLVAPLPCTAYFGKLAKLFGCSLPQQALA